MSNVGSTEPTAQVSSPQQPPPPPAENQKAIEEEPPIDVYALNPDKNSMYPNNFIRTAKYTIITFLPLNLFEQFRRASNLYFLLNMIIALIPGASPITPATAVVPLAFVVFVAMVKDGYEDYKRHRQDGIANSSQVIVVRDGKRLSIQSRDVRVGDILRLHENEEIRADCLVLSSPLPEGQTYIDTAQLDGETTVKPRKPVAITTSLNEYDSFKGPLDMHLSIDPPKPSLAQWKGVLNYKSEKVSLEIKQFLYRGSILRNTPWAFGLVVYAGVDTKLFRNLVQKPPKLSSMDKKLNLLIIGIFCFKHVCVFVLCGMAIWWNDVSNNRKAWYLSTLIDENHGGTLFGWRYMTYFILLSYMIPISLFVTMELCKAMQGGLMAWDLGMSRTLADGTVQMCRPQTTNLNEQLSQVQYVFTDKTGTLTENVMDYVAGNILGLMHDDRVDKGGLRKYLVDPQESRKEAVTRYLLCLALCNQVVPSLEGDGAAMSPGAAGATKKNTDVTQFLANEPESEVTFLYQAQSPDEVALAHAAARNGVQLRQRTSRTYLVAINGVATEFEILDELEFNADRKMMSVILRDGTGKILMFTKGADSSMLPRMEASLTPAQIEEVQQSLTNYACTGLRTLVIGWKEITQEDYDAWKKVYLTATCDMTKHRDLRVLEACLELEKAFHLVGITAIEDKLQDQVPETIRFLLDAEIDVWMLTGDKRETAVNIAASCGLINPQDDKVEHIDVHELSETNKLEAKARCLQRLQEIEKVLNASEKHRVCLVIDGVSLQVAMDADTPLFMSIATRVTSAVCCRLTPKQKADVVHLFQERGTTALAIGDGANDVSMIQEGRVGIGIMGLEGSQAELASDYAIPRFKHLKRLLFVHGRYALYRNASCICYSFYKNIVLSLCQVYYATFAGFSGVTFFDSWLLAVFNMIFTSLVPLAFGMFEKDLDESVLESNPQLYRALTKGLYFNANAARMWVTSILIHSACIFWFSYAMMVNDSFYHKNASMYQIGTMVLSMVVFSVDLRAAYHTRYWTIIPATALGLSFVAYIVFTIGYSSITVLWDDGSFNNVMMDLFSHAHSLLYWVLVPVGIVTFVDFGSKAVQVNFFPTGRDRMRREFVLGLEKTSSTTTNSQDHEMQSATTTANAPPALNNAGAVQSGSNRKPTPL